jgi:hypothetical protein
MMDSPNKNRERRFSLAIDLSGMDEKSRNLILKALAEECAKSYRPSAQYDVTSSTAKNLLTTKEIKHSQNLPSRY